MSFKKITTVAITSLALLSAPVMAQSAQASAHNGTSASVERSVAKSDKKSNQAGGISVVPLVLAAAIIAGGVYLIADDNNDNDNNFPTSP